MLSGVRDIQAPRVFDVGGFVGGRTTEALENITKPMEGVLPKQEVASNLGDQRREDHMARENLQRTWARAAEKARRMRTEANRVTQVAS